jgi:UDP-N-acetylglucosamine--N-acetylmuramyl-(pentapeptide) pyrophosphoryl-undecaprenol N-acetylglucosamine transferase
MKQKNTDSTRIIITGGGTGGHLFPGIALAQAMINTLPRCEVLFIGTERKVDRNGLANMGFKAISLKGLGIKGKSPMAKIKAILFQPVALFQAARIIRKFRPDLVFGVGGYISGPVILAARLLGATTCIHEQNSIPGLANRILGRIVHRVFVSLPGSENYFPASRVVFSGNPLRSAILEKASESRRKEDGVSMTLLVLGGSQGARPLNSLMLEAAEGSFAGLTPLPHIIHQTGMHDENRVREKYIALGITARVQAFFTDMAEVYGAADLAVSRAGATTIAELTACCKPAILVPVPHAADNHQEMNGRYLVEAGGAVMFRQAELDGNKLGEEIKRLLSDRKRLAEMAARAGKAAKPGATGTIVTECLKLLRNRAGSSRAKIFAV